MVVGYRDEHTWHAEKHEWNEECGLGALTNYKVERFMIM